MEKKIRAIFPSGAAPSRRQRLSATNLLVIAEVFAGETPALPAKTKF
jgi:hypothetical protein